MFIDRRRAHRHVLQRNHIPLFMFAVTLVLLAGLAAANAALAFHDSGPAMSEGDLRTLETIIHDRINAERAERGAPPVRRNARLDAVVRKHSKDMAENGYFSYTNLDGDGPEQRMNDQRVYCSKWSESIYRSRRSGDVEEIADRIMDGWMSRDIHRRNLLNPIFKTQGVGAAWDSGRIYLTQDFCRPEGNEDSSPSTPRPTSAPAPTATPTAPDPTSTPRPTRTPAPEPTATPRPTRTPTPTPRPDTTPGRVDIATLERLIHNGINEERTSRGVSALTRDSRLDAAARNHSEDMADHNYFSHTSRNGDSVGDRLDTQGVSCSAWGENIFQTWDRQSEEEIAASVVNGWMNSSGHRSNILNSMFRSQGVGVGIAPNGKLYVTEDFCR